MQVFTYDSTTFAFTGSIEAQRNPRDPDNFLTPEYSTTVALPAEYSELTDDLFFIEGSWVTQAKPVQQDYMAFWVALITSPYYSRVKMEAATSLPENVAATEFIALLGDAKAGMPLVPAIQASLDSLLSLIVATPEEQVFLTELFTSTGLEGKYTLNF